MTFRTDSKKKGFTMLELLVVIAIIGIITSIALVSLNTSKAKGVDGALQSELQHAKNQIELYYAANGNYGATLVAAGACPTTMPNTTLFANAKITEILNNAGKLSNGGNMGSGSCITTTNSWAVSFPLKTVTTDSWCVDSTGASRKVTPAGSDRGFNGSACK